MKGHYLQQLFCGFRNHVVKKPEGLLFVTVVRECFEETVAHLFLSKIIIKFLPQLDIWKNYTNILFTEKLGLLQEAWIWPLEIYVD